VHAQYIAPEHYSWLTDATCVRIYFLPSAAKWTDVPTTLPTQLWWLLVMCSPCRTLWFIGDNNKTTTYLLRGHIEGNCSQIHLAIRVDAWQNEEDARSACPTLTQPPQSKNYCPFILLHNLVKKYTINWNRVNSIKLSCACVRVYVCVCVCVWRKQKCTERASKKMEYLCLLTTVWVNWGLSLRMHRSVTLHTAVICDNTQSGRNCLTSQKTVLPSSSA